MRNKKLLALSIAAITLAGSMSLTGCGKDSDKKDSSTESVESTESTESSTEEEVDLTTLHTADDLESLDYSKVLKLGDYKNAISLSESDYTVSDTELQAEIDYYTDYYGTTEQIKEGTVASGDTVNIDYTGRIDGTEFDGGSATAQDLTVGSGTYLDDFEKGIEGMKVGETKTIQVTFPSDYSNNADLAGKTADFDITVNYIAGEKTAATYDDAFVEKITNGDYKKTDDFSAYIKKYLLANKKQSILTSFITAMKETTEFTGDISTYVETEYQAGVDYYTSYAESLDESLADLATSSGYADEAALLDYIKTDAESYVKQKMIIYAVGQELGFKLTDEDYDKGAQDIVDLYGYGSLSTLMTSYKPNVIRFDIYSGEITSDIIEANKNSTATPKEESTTSSTTESASETKTASDTKAN